MATIQRIDEIGTDNLFGRRVFLRADFNVPIEDGVVTDDTRIRAVLLTIYYLIANGARIVIATHQGRPKGQGYERVFSLAPVAKVLSDMLGQEVKLIDINAAEAAINELQPGEVLMLENLRFHSGEKQNDPKFAAQLASLADIYVNDAFACAHRAHASIVGITEHLSGSSYAGFLMCKEVEMLSKLLSKPEGPFVVVLGGNKVSDKIKVIESLLDKVDTLLIGGAMCFTFLFAQGHSVGTFSVERDMANWAIDVMAKAKEKGVSLVLPVDFITAVTPSSDEVDTHIHAIDVRCFPKSEMGLDIGPRTRETYSKFISEASTVFWNGPMGFFEKVPFENGTKVIADAVARTECMSVVGGGDTVAAINKFNVARKIRFISTGGGATLKYLEDKKLPGITALER